MSCSGDEDSASLACPPQKPWSRRNTDADTEMVQDVLGYACPYIKRFIQQTAGYLKDMETCLLYTSDAADE